MRSVRSAVTGVALVAVTAAGLLGAVAGPAAAVVSVRTATVDCSALSDDAKVVIDGALVAGDSLTVNYSKCHNFDITKIGSVFSGGSNVTGIPDNAAHTVTFTGYTSGDNLVTVTDGAKTFTLVTAAGLVTVTKVTICHRTSATTNPYRLITVAADSIVKSAGHGEHNTTKTNQVNPTSNGITPGSGPFDVSFAYPPNKKWWGDIIPPFAYSDSGTPKTYAGLNWSSSWGSPTSTDHGGAGKWIEDANFAEAITVSVPPTAYDLAVQQCVDLAAKGASDKAKEIDTAKKYYDKMVDGGQKPSEVIDDLKEQEADGDDTSDSALTTIQRSYTVKVRTVTAITIGVTSATLRGNLDAGRSWSVRYFQWGRSVTGSLSTTIEVSGGSGGVTQRLTGLTPSTRYYYRIVGVDTSGKTFIGQFQSFRTKDAGSVPGVTNDLYTTSYGTPLTIVVPGILANDPSATDVNDHTAPQFGKLVVNADGSFTYTPTVGFFGQDVFTYEANLSYGGTEWATVTIVVLPPSVLTEPKPHIGKPNTPVVITPGSTLNIKVQLTAVTIVAGPSHGTIAITSTGQIRYLPVLDYEGPDTFTYLIEGPTGERTLAVGSVKIAKPAIEALDDRFAFPKSGVLRISVLGNDRGKELTLVAYDTTTAEGGSVLKVGSGTLVYVPRSKKVTKDSFSYTIADSAGRTATAKVRIGVPVDVLPSTR